MIVLLSLAIPALATPDPGPVNDGLCLRLLVSPRSVAGQNGYDVRLDLLNASERAITLRTGWRTENTGEVKDFIEAATSIECFPPIAPWVGGVDAGHRTSPQREYTIKAGEVLSTHWQSNGRHLKNRVSDANEVQNPELPLPGLYSVHAVTNIIANERPVQLRSNEQLVSLGGSRAMPKHTFGHLLGVGPEEKTASLELGSQHKIELGDQFLILTGKREAWKLTVDQVKPSWCQGRLEPMLLIGQNPAEPKPRLPERGSNALLILPE